jgi:hypothetical protein
VQVAVEVAVEVAGGGDRVPLGMLYTILIVLAIIALLLFIFGRRSV